MIPKFILSNSLIFPWRWWSCKNCRCAGDARIESALKPRFVTAGCKLGSVFSSEFGGPKLARVKAAVQAFATYIKEFS